MPSTTKPGGFYSSSFWVDYLATQQSKLPVLYDVDDNISDSVVRFLGGNPGDMQLQGTNTYLIGTGTARILIDTGEHKPSKDQQAITNGQIFWTQGATLRAVLTPGHTVDHMCFLLEEENALFTGDNVLGHGYSVAECLGSYMTSLRLMASLGCTIGYPGHGAVIADLPRKIATYIAQRDSREKQVYEALVQQASYGGTGPGSTADTGSNKNGSVSSGRDSGGIDDEHGNETGIAQGLSVTDISLALYGEISKDTATFESALKPLLSQVLSMLVERGRASSMLAGPDKTRYWFIKGSRY
ncbi:hypothetical protein TARUN_2071 [Trichoderma arundinaceum]|uniref:Metallo-beta-lactamase domain-containing protein n=1 Tax=Trichoderma arundinaceum TaxID=490622 RepID=A0A395NVN2_TRIAR|nr:hypothetical protein TARUN_2071 [Trichoderma arundinaceum]